VSAVEVVHGDGPVVLGLPHTGTGVPAEVWDRLNERGRELSDTDWHVHRLYDGLLPGLTVVRATFHRYVVDANRPPGGESLYPGQATTGLVPETDFDGNPLWSKPPGPEEVAERVARFHAPYHAALAAEVERVRERHGAVLLWDAHSIRSTVPRLFPGTLPDLNLGTFDGRSCAPAVEAAAWEFSQSSPFRSVLNGRFKGGWTTRAYGHPERGIHAVQMEIAQSAYLESERAPWTYSERKAGRLRPWLRDIMEAAQDAALEAR
jgi:formiminoglutamase